MLYFKANFQIPDSGVQAAEVFAVVKDGEVVFYADRQLTIHLFSKNYYIPQIGDPYDYLLTLDEFANYTKIK